MFAVLIRSLDLNAGVPPVTSLDDDGTPMTLRSVVSQAGYMDVVEIQVEGTITLTQGAIIPLVPMIIKGPGPKQLTITSGGRSRLFELFHYTRITDVTLADGRHQTDGVSGFGEGGGIYSSASLVLSNCVVRNCIAAGTEGRDGSFDGPLNGFPGGDARGGGVSCRGSNVFLHCTFLGNEAHAGRGGYGFSPGFGVRIGSGGNGGHAYGGAIYCEGVSRFLACTLSDNRAPGGPGGNGGSSDRGGLGGGNGGSSGGGAVYSPTSHLVQARSCTIASNTATGGAGGLAGGPPGIGGLPGKGSGGGLAVGSLRIHNSIVARNHAEIHPDLYSQSSVFSDGFNLIGRQSLGNWNAGNGDQLGNPTPIDPQLAPLSDADGPTPTHALLPGSPAIDQGHVSLNWQNRPYHCDQRFFPRPRNVPESLIPNALEGDGNDIGAYEFQPPIRLRIELGPPGFVRICWMAEPNERYELLCANDPGAPLASWTPVTSVTGGITSQEWCQPVALNPAPAQKFFVVRAVKP